jgi:hypothetical protein
MHAAESAIRVRDAAADGLVDCCAVRALRRVMLVIGVAAIIGALAKLRGKGGVPPTTGGWRELEAPEFR